MGDVSFETWVSDSIIIVVDLINIIWPHQIYLCESTLIKLLLLLLLLSLLLLCCSRKYPYSPHRRDWNFLWGGGSVRPKNLKKCMKLNWNFQRGWGLEEIPSMVEVWIFSGITHHDFS